MKEATRVKNLFTDASNKGLTLLQEIAKDEAWEWARATKARTLERRITTLRQALTSWGNGYMLSGSTKELKKGLTQERLLEELKLIAELTPKIKDVEDFCHGLLEAKRSMPA